MLEGQVVRVDRFGNLVTNIDRRLFDQFRHDGAIRIAVNGQSIDRLVATYAEAPAGQALRAVRQHRAPGTGGERRQRPPSSCSVGRGAGVRIDRN